MRPSHLETRYKHDLSPRQTEVLELIERGRTNAEIAEALGITLDGAKYHVREILAKLGVASREEAVAAWKSGRARRRWRWIEALSIGAGVAKAAGIAAAAIGAGAVAAVALVLTMGGNDGGDGGAPAHAPSMTPTAAVTAAATATPSAIRTQAATLPPCLPGEVTGALEATREGDDVRISLRLTGTARCELNGPVSLQTLFPPHGATVPFANLSREYNASVQFPFDGVVGEWLWGNWCGEAVTVPWLASTGPAESRSAFANLQVGQGHPACISEGAPTALRDAIVSVALDPKYAPATCSGPIAGWLCDYAVRLATDLAAGDIRAAFRGSWAETGYTCGDGVLPGYDYSALCEGATEGEVRHGFPLALHGSHGGPVTFAAMIARLEPLLAADVGPAGFRPFPSSSVGFLADGSAADTFIVAIRRHIEPMTVYLAFRLTPGREPAFIGAGLSGDNALTILNGGVTNSVLGETEFVPLGVR